MGSCHYVFSGANHTRFEHSVGTAHLSKKMFKSLLKNSKDNLNLNDFSREYQNNLQNVVTLAGLCHDIGHGPFSHAFDEVINKLYSNENEDV